MTCRKAIKQAILSRDYINFKKCLEDDPSLVTDSFVNLTAKETGNRLFSAILLAKMTPTTKAEDMSFVKTRRKKFLQTSDIVSSARIDVRRKG